MKATWNGEVVAESENTIVVEENNYFPPDAIKESFFQKNENTYQCPWKGTAHYYDLNVGGKLNKDAAWVYPEPKEAASEIAGYVAFWNGVEVSDA